MLRGVDPVGSAGSGVGARHRVVVLLLVLVAALGLIVARLVQVQVVEAERYTRVGISQRLREIALAPERGAVFDRNGSVLALSMPAKSVWADPRVVKDPAAYAAKLASVLATDEATLLKRLARKDTAFVYLDRKVDDATVTLVEQMKLPGVAFVPESKRFYPSGALAAPLLGKVGIDNEGLAGLEVAHESALAGHAGTLVVERDRAGRDIPIGTHRLTPAAPGQDLVLTIDQALQFEVERVLTEEVDSARAKGGMAVVMDTRTGDVLALANVDGAVRDVPAHSASADSRNRVLTDAYQPGSTAKVITIAGALEERLVSPTSVFHVADQLKVGDHVFSDNERHAPVDWTVADILAESSNVGTITIAKSLGKTRLDSYLRRFGFGVKTDIGFPGEASGILMDPKRWDSTSIGTVPIGTAIGVTVLQMLNVYATIANDGVWRQPRIVAATVDAEGVRTNTPTAATRRVVSTRTAGQLNAMLREVVKRGTGTKAVVPGYSIAGKTGTARKPLEGKRGYSNDYMASFVGFAPAERPRLAVAVVLDDPGTEIYGGVVAAPGFARIMQAALRLERVAPSASALDLPLKQATATLTRAASPKRAT